MAGAHQLAAIAGFGGQPLRIGNAMPLANEPLAMFIERCGQGADGLLQGGMVALAKTNGKRELACTICSRRTQVKLTQ